VRQGLRLVGEPPRLMAPAAACRQAA